MYLGMVLAVITAGTLVQFSPNDSARLRLILGGSVAYLLIVHLSSLLLYFYFEQQKTMQTLLETIHQHPRYIDLLAVVDPAVVLLPRNSSVMIIPPNDSSDELVTAIRA